MRKGDMLEVRHQETVTARAKTSTAEAQVPGDALVPVLTLRGTVHLHGAPYSQGGRVATSMSQQMETTKWAGCQKHYDTWTNDPRLLPIKK